MDIHNIRLQLRQKTIYEVPLRVTFYARVSTDSQEQLNSLTNQISYYEDNGYPQEFVERFYDTEFTPSCSNTFAAGHKLVKLYRNVLVMIEMLEDNEEDFYITFYSSF